MQQHKCVHVLALFVILGGSSGAFATPKKIQIKFHVAYVDVPATDSIQISYDDVTPGDQETISNALMPGHTSPPLPAWSILVDNKLSAVGVKSASNANRGIIRLQLMEPFGADVVSKHHITVLFAGDSATGVQPETVDVKQPKPHEVGLNGWFFPKLNFITDKTKANLDVSGSLQTGVGATPQYQWSVMAQTPFEYVDDSWIFKAAPKFTGASSQETNANPDSMIASAVTEFDFPKASVLGRPLPINLSFDPTDYEFELKAQQEAVLENGKPVLHTYQNKNTNLLVAGQVQLVEAWGPVNVNINLGTELGSAVSRSVQNATPKPGYSDNPLRAVAGADVYFNLPTVGKYPLLSIDGDYTVRSPFHPEPFKEAGVNNGNEFYSTKARHYIAVNLARTLVKGSNLTVQYRYGSLPPTFNFVDHQVTIGFEVVLGK